MKKSLSILLALLLLGGTLGVFAVGTYAEEPDAPEGFGTVYENNFDSYDAGTYTAEELKDLVGFKSTTNTPGSVYQITEDGKLRLHVPYQNPDFTTNKMNTEMDINIGEFEQFENTDGKIVIEFERTLNESVTHGAFWTMVYIAKNAQNFIAPAISCQGFVFGRIRINNGWRMPYQNRPNYIPFNRLVSGYNYPVGDNYGTPVSNHYSTFGSTDIIRIEIGRYSGITTYVNGVAVHTTETNKSWAESDFNAVIGKLLSIRVQPGIDVTYDNIKVTTEAYENPELLITEIMAAPNDAKGAQEYLEVYNNSTRALDIYDYLILRSENATKTEVNDCVINESQIARIYKGTHTFTTSTGSSATFTNPDDGTILPGQSAILFIPTNTTLTGAGTPNSNTLEDFKTHYGLTDEKVFVCYNNFNFSLWNSGDLTYAVGHADVNYVGKLNVVFGMYVSFVHANTATATLLGVNYGLSKFAAAGASVEYYYPNGNKNFHGLFLKSVAGEHSAGTALSDQKRAFTGTNALTGDSETAYLGDSIETVIGDARLVYFKVNGAYQTDPEDFIVTADFEYAALTIDTMAGAGVRTASPTGLRWKTVINKAEYDALKASDAVKNIEIGTLIAPTKYIEEAGAFTFEALDSLTFLPGDEDHYRDVKASDEAFYETSETDYIFAGSLVSILEENYNLRFSGIGYVKITLADDTVVTIYCDYFAASHSRTVAYVAKAAIEDEENGLTEDQIAAITPFANAYDPASEK